MYEKASKYRVSSRKGIEKDINIKVIKKVLFWKKPFLYVNDSFFFLPLHFRGENGTVQNEDDETQDGDKKKSRLPKKKFLFTESIKYVLYITAVMHVFSCL